MFLKPSETAKSYKRGSQALSMAQKKPVPAWPKLSKGNLPSALSGTFFESTLRNAVHDVSFGRLHERTTDEGTDRTAECARNEMLLPYALSPVPLSSRPSTFVPELRMKKDKDPLSAPCRRSGLPKKDSRTFACCSGLTMRSIAIVRKKSCALLPSPSSSRRPFLHLFG